MMTLDDFAKKILKPTVVGAIKDGSLDGALFDPDVIEIILDDDELMAAAIERLRRAAHANL